MTQVGREGICRSVLDAVRARLLAACDDDDDEFPRDAPGIGAVTFSVTLAPSAEVPVCPAAGSTATGTTTVAIAADESSVTVQDLTFSGLSGPATAAHIHSGAPDVAGPIVFNLGTELQPPINATFTAADYPSQPPAGAPADYPSFILQMKTGGTYINVHTDACPMGEIRAQLQ